MAHAQEAVITQGLAPYPLFGPFQKILTPDPATYWQTEEKSLHKLQNEYQSLAENGGWPEWKIQKKIKPGQSAASIPVLRQILTIMGDYHGAPGVLASSQQYDPALVAAVKHFQLRHGLNPDGVLGRSAQAALAVPVETRVAQIAATLERLRGKDNLPAENRFILVNLPAYRLFAYENGKPELDMRVIVGGVKNHTPLFDNEVTDVVFNPPWSVPARIAKNELLPKLHTDPAYFIRSGFIVKQDGIAVDPMHIKPDDNDVSFRQSPGEDNALGKIKFNIPDADNIYLHSTSSPHLFSKDFRALSHGCVRVEKPRELAYFVMTDKQGWDKTKIDHAYDSNTQRYVKSQPTPVHLVYWTAFVDETGTAYFYNDVYDMDESVTAEGDDSIQVQ